MTTQQLTEQEQERRRQLWWQDIIDEDAEPELASHKDEAIPLIEAAIAHYRTERDAEAAAKEKRVGKSPFAFTYEEAAAMRKRVEKLKRDIQPYLPHPSTKAEFQLKVRQTIANLDLVAEWLGDEESGMVWSAKKPVKQGGSERKRLLQELVAELVRIRQRFTSHSLDWRGATENYLRACCAGLGVKETTITNAKTYVIKHLSEFGMERAEVGDANPERTVP